MSTTIRQMYYIVQMYTPTNSLDDDGVVVHKEISVSVEMFGALYEYVKVNVNLMVKGDWT